jgi:hypothetical protein
MIRKIAVTCCLGIIVLVVFLIYGLNEQMNENDSQLRDEYKDVSNDINLEEIKKIYSDYVLLNDGKYLYKKVNDEYVIDSTVYGAIELELDSSYQIVDEYFRVLNSDYYVKYSDITSLKKMTSVTGEYKYYKNYVVYNENVSLMKKAKLYVNDNSYYEVNGGNYPIIIKDTNRYGIEYNNSLVYVNSTDVVEVLESNNTDLNYANGVSVLNYHYVVSSTNENGELDECNQDICITDTMFDSHIKYLKENGYYGVSMRDLELFIDGKIQLPKNSVVITIDDGWYLTRSIAILNKYQFHGTLFLIGSLANPDDYESEYLEIHSHSYNLHKLGDCSSNIGRGGILCLDDEAILNDLKQSRESLDNTTYFCYPFYDYNNRAIELLKKAGFTMAFVGETKDNTVRVGQDKFLIPRYVIVNYTTMGDFIDFVTVA